jgi:hypothetical protein
MSIYRTGEILRGTPYNLQVFKAKFNRIACGLLDLKFPSLGHLSEAEFTAQCYLTFIPADWT